MMSTRAPFVSLIALYVLFGGFLVESLPLFPVRMASHFGSGGVADGWMSRLTFAQSLWKAGTLIALAVCLFQCVRWIPSKWITHSSEEELNQQRKNLDHFLYWMVWMACLGLVALSGINYLTLLANRQNPPVLPHLGLGIWISSLLVGVVGILVKIIIPFLKKPA